MELDPRIKLRAILWLIEPWVLLFLVEEGLGELRMPLCCRSILEWATKFLRKDIRFSEFVLNCL